MERDTVHFVLYNLANRVLMQFRDEKAPTYPCAWGFFGGGIKKNETPEEALYREIYEELRYVPKQPKMFCQFPYDCSPDYNMSGIDHYFIEQYDNKTRLELHEGKDMKWFSLDDLDNIKMLTIPEQIIKIIKTKISGKS